MRLGKLPNKSSTWKKIITIEIWKTIINYAAIKKTKITKVMSHLDEISSQLYETLKIIIKLYGPWKKSIKCHVTLGKHQKMM